MSLNEYIRSARPIAAWGRIRPTMSVQVVVLILIHGAALAIMARTESDLVSSVNFLLTWGLLNFFWLIVLRRPVPAGALALAMLVTLVLVSQLKHSVMLMTVNFVDLMIIDGETIAFLLQVFPSLGVAILAAVAVVVPLLVLLWRRDCRRMTRISATAGGTACLAGLVGLGVAFPMEHFEAFYPEGYVSKFSRSAIMAVSEYATHGLMQSDAVVKGQLKSAAGMTCAPRKKPPNIVMVLDESSFDIRAVPGVKVPVGYGEHFRSFDGRQRSFAVEGVGGPTWYTEYNVLTGLSSRSFGQFAYFVTRIAAGRVERGLPQALRRCGYKTFSLYPAPGAFLSARSFQTTAGVQRFFDSAEMGAVGAQPDHFYYDKAARLIARERGDAPLFVFVYLAANHFPWDTRYRPELTPNWAPLGNAPKVDEYIRRQTMSAADYKDFLARLKRDFPSEPFLLVRFGDHQPEFAERILEPGIAPAALAQRYQSYDSRYFTTYYALDSINFKPAAMPSALPRIDAPYLPLVIQEAAGLPLDPSYQEQKKIFERCGGVFYACNGGAEARRFNRLLIDAGLIKRL